MKTITVENEFLDRKQPIIFAMKASAKNALIFEKYQLLFDPRTFKDATFFFLLYRIIKLLLKSTMYKW